MPTIELGSRWRSPSMYARAMGDSPLAPKRPLSWMKTPTAEARRKVIEYLPHRRRQPTKTSERHVVVVSPERAPERSRFGTDLDRRIAFGSPIVSPELFLQERTVVRIGDHGRSGERQPKAYHLVRIPQRRQAVYELRPRDHAREVRVDVVVRPERADVRSSSEPLVLACRGKQHPPAYRESKRTDRHLARIRHGLQSREGRVNDRGRTGFEIAFLDERELGQHHEVPRPRERFGEPHGLGIVVPERRGPVHHHQSRMTVAPARPPPRHPHLDAPE